MSLPTLTDFCEVVAPLWREVFATYRQVPFYVPHEINAVWASVNLLGLANSECAVGTVLHARFSATLVSGWAFDAAKDASALGRPGTYCLAGKSCTTKFMRWYGSAVERAKCPLIGAITVLADASGLVKPYLADVVASTAAKLVAYDMVESPR